MLAGMLPAGNLPEAKSSCNVPLDLLSSLRPSANPAGGSMPNSFTHTVLSLGAGVQSTVLALLLDNPRSSVRRLGYSRPDVAIFADTGWEPEYVYRHLRWLRGKLSFRVKVVSAASIRENLPRGRSANGYRFVDVPLFTRDVTGKKGMLRRQCTTNYKMQPIRKHLRKLVGAKPHCPVPKDVMVDMLIGLSIDEVTRQKPSQDNWIEHNWPLIDAGMSRDDCIDWFTDRYPRRYLPRSACVICPFRSDSHWLEMRDQDPVSFEEAVEFDRRMRNSSSPIRRLLDGTPYLHSSRRPLDTAIKRAEKFGMENIEHFDNECEGMCGV